ncbi:MAG: hypothetical protein ACREYE_29165, partial [Gammaproteobacteria bacterium]
MSPEEEAGESSAPADEAQPDAPSDECQPETGTDSEQVEIEQQDLAAVEELTPPPPIPPVVDVHDLDWDRIGASLEPAALRAHIRETVVSFRQVCGGAVRSSLAEIPVRLSRRRIRARTVRERTAIWPA